MPFRVVIFLFVGGGRKVSVMGVLTLLLGHELDRQIDKVLWLAQKYDEDENAFRFRYGALVVLSGTIHTTLLVLL